MPDTERLPLLRSPDFRKFYVTNVVGGMTSQDIRFEILNEKIRDEKGNWAGVSDALIILSPVGAKRLLKLLEKAIDLYEREHGEISTEFESEEVY